ncbi:rod shape-determining protein RodA [Spirochaeta thermophila DSM 6578]|uniref:Peptidoglycan glycosyltransferase RodA n=1 Tax=Winmispira thermophila (strain ATCC 700085 / DSM 6578 / Z-1203) TaxID=869211 RepID=G0GE36_WINT7|nr:rod shape-determining protein RodA [Spirochaeta thermophila]AEJ61389.1 rod shape-determining protein RodA [Spirochaeta thermophila DSM 6578]
MRRLIKGQWAYTDWVLLVTVQILVCIGILFIYSSGITSTGERYNDEYIRQIVWAVSGIGLLLVFSMLDYQIYKNLAFVIFLSLLFLLVLTLFIGKSVKGAQAWLGIGDLGIQPSEFMKVATILVLAHFLEERAGEVTSLKVFGQAFLIVMIPVVVILLQPDFGTAMVYIPIFLTMSFVAGTPIRYIVFWGLVGVLSLFWTVFPWMVEIFHLSPLYAEIFAGSLSPFILLGTGVVLLLLLAGYFITKSRAFYWGSFFCALLLIPLVLSFPVRGFLKEYQIMRLIVFLDPYVDARGAGWNIIQSLTAIGSGGIWGKGFLQGTQSHYQYLPQQSTDFIFSILAEEWGFVGAVGLFFLYLVILVRIFRTAVLAPDVFGRLIAAGIGGMFLFHFMVNVGMTLGIMPITGIPLFLVSYGGSSLWTALISVGMVLNIYRNRYTA